MENIKQNLLAIIVIVFLCSCGFSHSMISNTNLNNTQVSLSANNFKIVDKVSGSSEVSYILIIGGMKEKQLYENAYSAMMNKANLMNGSRAVVNVVTEEHLGGLFPIFYTRTITVSANVIEFTK